MYNVCIKQKLPFATKIIVKSSRDTRPIFFSIFSYEIQLQVKSVPENQN
jgi:hypothetical protein